MSKFTQIQWEVAVDHNLCEAELEVLTEAAAQGWTVDECYDSLRSAASSYYGDDVDTDELWEVGYPDYVLALEKLQALVR